MKKKNIFITAIIATVVLLLVYICAFTNIIFNHSCVGITYYNGSGMTGMEVLVNYFENESKAKKYYKENNITHYVLAAEDTSKSDLTTKEWFSALQQPLVSESRKLCYIAYIESIFSSNELLTDWLIKENLMVYYTSEQLENVSFDSISDKTYNPTNSALTFINNIHDDFTDEEKEYLTFIVLNGLSLCESIECYELSLNAEDNFSKNYWEIQLENYIDMLKNAVVPTIERENLNWQNIDSELNKYVNILDKCFNDEKNNEVLSSYFTAETKGFSSWILLLSIDCKEKPGNITLQQFNSDKDVDIPAENAQIESIRTYIRNKSDGTYKNAKEIFEKTYANSEFLMEHFFTDKELETIKEFEDNGKRKIDYETYDKGWVKIISLIGEVGDEVVYIGEQDPFATDYIWK